MREMKTRSEQLTGVIEKLVNEIQEGRKNNKLIKKVSERLYLT